MEMLITFTWVSNWDDAARIWNPSIFGRAGLQTLVETLDTDRKGPPPEAMTMAHKIS